MNYQGSHWGPFFISYELETSTIVEKYYPKFHNLSCHNQKLYLTLQHRN